MPSSVSEVIEISREVFEAKRSNVKFVNCNNDPVKELEDVRLSERLA